MSAAATAAGYLYASGRLRGKSKEGEEAHRVERPQLKRKEIRVAALPDVNEYPTARKERPPVKVAYRTRRWRPDGE
jgi:hypothetical protein